jgi:hypothetical protein
MKNSLTISFLFVAFLSFGQTITNQFYNVTSGTGNGIRFWQSDDYKIHMGNATQYRYGPVTDYSMKFGMSNHTGRGWTWGETGKVPIAALCNLGNMQIEGTFNASRLESSHLRIDHVVNYDWGFAATIKVNRDYTKAFVVQNTSQSSPFDVFRIWGNGVVNAKRIYAEEFSVQANTFSIYWPDYVFSTDYKLRPLNELKKFIEVNKHLPDIPSECEVEENGVNLLEMNVALLKKIEELTLYILEQEERISALEKAQ